MDSTARNWPCVCILWRGGVSCPVPAAWHSCVAAHWSKYHCYKQAPSRYDLRCFKAMLNPNNKSTKMCHLNFRSLNWDIFTDSIAWYHSTTQVDKKVIWLVMCYYYINHKIFWHNHIYSMLVGWLVVFYVPSTARSLRDSTPIYCPLRRTWSWVNSPFPPGIKPRAVTWHSITLPLRQSSSTFIVWVQ